MLGGAWLFITIALLLTAAVLQQVLLLLVALLFFLASAVSRLWAYYALERVEYGRHLSTTRAFFGETIVLDTQIANNKMLPLPWVHVQDEMPEELTVVVTGVSTKPTKEGRVTRVTFEFAAAAGQVELFTELTGQRASLSIEPVQIGFNMPADEPNEGVDQVTGEVR